MSFTFSFSDFLLAWYMSVRMATEAEMTRVPRPDQAAGVTPILARKVTLYQLGDSNSEVYIFQIWKQDGYVTLPGLFSLGGRLGLLGRWSERGTVPRILKLL